MAEDIMVVYSFGLAEYFDQTYKVLKNNGTNIISHFIERPGRGYREQLFRCMLYAYSLLPEKKDSTFRAAAKLNLAKCVSVEPALTEGGEKAYSIQLFDEVSKRRWVILMLKKVILNNWKSDIEGYAQSITELEHSGYPAWTVKYDDSYGVAIPYEGSDDINESFTSAKIRSANIKFHDGNIRRALVLTSDAQEIRINFHLFVKL